MSELHENANENIITQTQDSQLDTKDDASKGKNVASLGLTQDEFDEQKEVKYFDLFTVGKTPACRFCGCQPCLKYRYLEKINQCVEEIDLIYGENKTNKQKRYNVQFC